METLGGEIDRNSRMHEARDLLHRLCRSRLKLRNIRFDAQLTFSVRYIYIYIYVYISTHAYRLIQISKVELLEEF